MRAHWIDPTLHRWLMDIDDDAPEQEDADARRAEQMIAARLRQKAQQDRIVEPAR